MGLAGGGMVERREGLKNGRKERRKEERRLWKNEIKRRFKGSRK